MDKLFKQVSGGSLIDNNKNLPELEEIEAENDIYTLEPHTSYSVTIKDKIKIPVGYTMLYLPRSTLLFICISSYCRRPRILWYFTIYDSK